MSETPREVLARVDEELRALWAAAPRPGEVPRARACTVNLIVVADSPALAEAFVPVVEDVVQSMPARALVVGLDPDGADGLEADVSAVCAPAPDGRGAVCSERVHFVARGAACVRVPSVLSTLCRSDVPTTLVWLGHVHADDPTFAPLARDAARIVLDAAHGSLASIANVVYWARARAAAERPGVADLAWTRLAPWQELCARLFDEPRLRPLAGGVTHLTITQASSPGAPLAADGALLLGWLATRLGWRAAAYAGKLRLLRADGGTMSVALRSQPAGAVTSEALQAVRLEARAGDLAMTGEIARDADAATWRLEVHPAGGEPSRLEHRVRLWSTGTGRLLERTLRRPAHDHALAEAVAWADELRGEELACC